MNNSESGRHSKRYSQRRQSKEKWAIKRRRGMQPQSFQDFYSISKNECFRALSVTVQSFNEAEDLLAESFVRAFEDWENLQNHPSPQAWVVRTGLNLHRDRWRRVLTANKHRSLERSESIDKYEFVDPALLEAIRSLPAKQREVIAFRVLLDLSIEQTAAEMKIAPGTVAAHLNRALASLRTVLQKSIWLEEK